MKNFYQKLIKEKGFTQHHLAGTKTIKSFFHTVYKSGAGFTLLEMVLYLVIVGVLLVAVVDFHFVLGGTSVKLKSNITASNNRRISMNAIDYLIRNADGLLYDVERASCSDLVSDPPVLALYFDNDDYLPGTCVATGGGVRVTTVDNRLVMECQPNVSNNGQYQACDTTVFPTSTTYYLTSPDVQVFDTTLNFVTSTATTTNDTFLTIRTNLSLSNISDGETGLLATSTATSTVIMRNESFYDNSLIAWWKLDDDPTSSAVDSANSHDGTCSPAPDPVAGLINGSSGAFDFDYAASEYCLVSDATDLNFNRGFSFTAWFKAESFPNVDEHLIFYKEDHDKGYAFGMNNVPEFFCRVCDSVSCEDSTEDDSTISTGSTYHVACIYNPDNDQLKLYVYQEGVGGQGTTTQATTKILVNNAQDMGIGRSSHGQYFDGVIDEVRIYNRVLSDSEVWALQSQGAVAD